MSYNIITFLESTMWEWIAVRSMNSGRTYRNAGNVFVKITNFGPTIRLLDRYMGENNMNDDIAPHELLRQTDPFSEGSP